MLHIHLLGHLRLFDGDEPRRFAALPKTLSLFAYLLLHRAESLPREAVAYTLWPDVPDAEARANLRRHLHDLKRSLPPEPPDAPWILADHRSLQWNAFSPAWLDVAEFERLSNDARRRTEAVALYTGDLLPSLYDDWIAPSRERLRQAYLASLSRLVEQHRTRQDFLQAIVYAEQLLRSDPLREDAARELIALRCAAGDRPGALQEYQSFARRLHDELGTPPMPETTALYQSLLQGTAQVSPRPAEARHVPPAPEPPIRPRRWPAPVTRLIGRQPELAELERLVTMDDDAARLVTLIGPGGTGKTRLGLALLDRLAADRASLFPDGLGFVPLSALNDPALVVPALADALGQAGAGWPALLNVLRDKRLLLVIDNFEHVAEAAPVLAELLAAAPGLRLVITSRAVLHLYGEHTFPVPPLSLPDSSQRSPEALLGFAAVALFVERARAYNRGFALTADNAPAVAEICARLDGLPLALELAAARTRLLSPAALLDRLAASLASATRPGAAGPPQQQTLRATLEWSYSLLAPIEQRLFARLAVFAGGWTVEALEAVVDEPAVLDRLAALVDKSMVRTVPGESRFRLLLTVREFALEKLAAHSERGTWHAAHARFYLALAQYANVGLNGPQQGAYLQQLDAEHDNLRAALGWALGAEPDLALRLAAALARYWEARGHLAEAQRWLGPLLALPGEPDMEARAGALLAAGFIAARLGDHAAAERHFQAGLNLYQALGHRAGVARARNGLGAALVGPGRADEAHSHFEQALSLFRQLGDRAGEAEALNHLARQAYYAGRYDEARRLDLQSLDLRRSLGDTRGVAGSLNNLGLVDLALGDYAAALARHQETLAVRRALGLKPGVAQSLLNLATAHAYRGEAAAARAGYQQAVELYWQLGALGGLAEGFEGLARLDAAEGRPERAARLFGAADTLRVVIRFAPDRAFQDAHERAVAASRHSLTPAVYEAAFQAGQALPLSQAVAFALEGALPHSDAFWTAGA